MSKFEQVKCEYTGGDIADQPDDASPDRERLETVGAFLDVFDEYLEEKGYSTDDTCLLADKIEELLRRFGALKE